jgi:response regulator NasT
VRVLIVEDEWLVSYTLRHMLEEHGHTVVGIATDAAEVLDLRDRERPEIVLMDLRLRSSDGLQAARDIMETSPVCIIMVTACDVGDRLAEVEAAGAMAYLVKPVMSQELTARMQAARLRFDRFLAIHEQEPSLDEALGILKLIEGGESLVSEQCCPPE